MLSYKMLRGLGAVFVLAALGPAAAEARAVNVLDGIQARRTMEVAPIADWSPGMQQALTRQSVLTSPDGRRYVLLIVRGDFAANGNWLEVMSGETTSLEAARPHLIARLFMSSLGEEFGGGTSTLTFSPGSFNHVAWLDERRLTLMWGDRRNVTQIYAIDIRSGRTEQLTQSPTHVRAYALASSGALIYAAQERLDRDRAAALANRNHGFIVRNPEALSLMAGDTDGYSIYDWIANSRLYLKAPRRQARALGDGPLRYSPSIMSFSPDGASVLVAMSPQRLPDAWSTYRERFLRRNLNDLARHGLDGVLGRLAQQLYVVDVRTGTMRALWDAPITSRTQAVWSPDGRWLALASTPTPADGANATGLDGLAAAIVDVASGAYTQLAFDAVARAPRWEGSARLAFQVGADTVFAEREGQSWRIIEATQEAGRAEATASADREAQMPPSADPGAVRLELRQDLNTPPRLFGVAANGEERMLFDLNPALGGEIELAPAEIVRWTDASGRDWTGLLHRPLHAEPGRRYPLVIQTHNHTPATQFSLYGKSGSGLGPGVSAYSAQVLAGRGMVVLTIQDQRGSELMTPSETRMYIEGYEAGVALLEGQGLIDPDRIGIVGFSRTGWHVEQALAHSRLNFTAAIVIDKSDPSYMGGALTGWPEEHRMTLGTEPSGEGLDVWTRASAAAHADQITTPVQLVLHSAGLAGALTHWEMYTRLRYFDRSVEFYMAPDIDQGSHGPQNPRQLYALQSDLVDWFDFWLAGRETPPAADAQTQALDAYDATRADRYQRWRALRDNHCGLYASGAESPSGPQSGVGASLRAERPPWYCENAQ